METGRALQGMLAAFVAITAFAGCDPPKLAPNPAATLDFGPTYVGTGMPRPASWVNSGGTDATVPQIVIGGANGANFRAFPFVPVPAKAVAKNGAVNGPLTPPATLVFFPPDVGQFAATATPTVTEMGATATARALQGEGIMHYAVGDLTVGGPAIVVQPPKPVNFGRVQVGRQSPIITFDVQNIVFPTQNIRITKVQLYLNNQGFTYVGPQPPFNVPKNGKVAVQLRFAPPAFPNPPLESMFRDGITFFEVQTDSFGNITAQKSAAGAALCGVGFHPSETPPNPPMTCP